MNMNTTNRLVRGRLFFNRDYHIHLGGAIPPSFIADWINDGRLSLNDEIPDLVAASSSSSARGNIPIITVRQALLRYRSVTPSQLDLNGRDIYLSAYNTPAYTSLPTFLTLYRAYSNRRLIRDNASQIARGSLVHPSSDIRISIPHPNSEQSDECPLEYAKRALNEMHYFRSCLLPSQQLFITFPRQTFNKNENWSYFASFVDLLESMTDNISWAKPDQLAFDFAGQPLPLTLTLPLLEKLRNNFPSALISYHHGELCPHIPFSDRVRDTSLLLPYVNRIVHGLCLGLAVLGINPDEGGSTNNEVIKSNKEVAFECLDQMAKLNIGIEVSPTCNISLGGARDKQTLRRYVNAFLDAGVNVFVGTDDPGFLGTSLENEVAILKGVDL